MRIVLAVAASWLLAALVARVDNPIAVSAVDALFALALLTTYVGICALVVRRAGVDRRVALFKTVIVTTTLLAMVAVLEAPVLLGWLDYQQAWDALTGNWRGPSVEYQLDFERAFRRRPNTHIVGSPQGDVAGRFNLPLRSPRPLEFTFNDRGFRGPSLAAADVALVGDSFIEGWFVSDGETAADILAARTGRPVANLGQSGYGSAQELKVLEQDALPLHPRLIVWFFYEGNDLYDDENFEDTMLYLKQAKGSPDEIARGMGYGRSRFRQASFTVNAFSALRRALDPIVPNEAPYHGQFRDATGRSVRLYFSSDATGEFGSYEQDRLLKAEESIREGKRLCDRNGISLLVAYIPVKFRVYGDLCDLSPSSPCRSWRLWDLPSRLDAFSTREGIDFIDLTGPFRSKAQAGELLYVPQDTHWDRKAHELVAGLIEARYRASMR